MSGIYLSYRNLYCCLWQTQACSTFSLTNDLDHKCLCAFISWSVLQYSTPKLRDSLNPGASHCEHAGSRRLPSSSIFDHCQFLILLILVTDELYLSLHSIHHLHHTRHQDLYIVGKEGGFDTTISKFISYVCHLYLLFVKTIAEHRNCLV